MALKQTMTLVNNFGEDSVFNDAYIKVQLVNCNKEHGTMRYTVQKTSDAPVLKQTELMFPVSVESRSENFIKQAYNYLKTLPEFKDASDC